MPAKKPDLDADTLRVLKRVLSMPPKHHDEMKVGTPTKKKKRDPKGRAASSKPQGA
ncbi:MAG: hypothetical protein WDO24_13550 [Pseudomonadota bacterium]